MPIFTKADLQYTDYSWTAIKGDNPRLTGNPDHAELNRREGYEVVDFIEGFCTRHNDVNGNRLTKDHGKKAERLIRKHLPGDVRSRAKVDQWLLDNWAKY